MFSMPTSFSDFVEKSIRIGPYIWTLLGVVFSLFGLYTYLSQIRIESSSIPVSLIVLHMKEGSSKNRDSFAVKYEIVEGDYIGKTYLSKIYSRPPIHHVGDQVDGWYQKESGIIRSDKMVARLKAFGGMFGINGLILAIVGICWVFSRRIKFFESPIK